MSWYFGTFYCGHEGYIHLNGSAKMRSRMKEYRFSQLCPECSTSDAIRFRQHQKAKASEYTQQLELPALEGSARQISWATLLRVDICSRLERYLDHPAHPSSILEQFERNSGAAVDLFPDTLPQFFQEFLYYLQNTKTRSVYWIDNRYTDSRRILLDALPDYLSWRQHHKLQFLTENFFSAESLLSPMEPLFPGFVVLKHSDRQLRAYYEKNPVFQTIMKKQRFRWNGSFWIRSLTEHSGSVSDRLAQLGNLLLNEGFRVSIDDPETRAHAVNADFTLEHSRWIQCGINGMQFCIELSPLDPPSIRQNLMRIPTATYRYGSILVDVSHYAELEDFAHYYDFRFDDKAIQLLEQYKSLLAQSVRVHPVCPKEPEPQDFLRQILESSGSILKDLTDEDEATCD